MKPAVTLDEALFTNIGEHFDQVVENNADRVAIESESGRLSYRDFNARANQVAHAVLAETEGRAERVALLFDQGADAIIAMFGVLKAGSAFVHLDASNPVSKLEEIRQSATPVIILTDSEHLEKAGRVADGKATVMDVTSLPETFSTENPEVDIPPDATAYIFFTSGSTGNPKGVCQTQRNLFHFIRVYSGSLSVSADDRLSLLYSLGFSASNMDVFSALLTGAALHPYDIKKFGTAGLADWIDSSEISILHAVPTVFRHLCNSLADGRKLRSVKGIDLGGEAVQRRDVEFFNAHFESDCTMINHLAATEASVIAQYKIDTSAEYSEDLLPVGYAADGVELRVVDSEGNRLEDGETGEIQVCSAYVSPGYWKMPELNEKIFRDDPSVPGGRMYLSGDLGYVGKDGKFYFLGRKDHRVKIRGYSVDTSEVESAIRKCLPDLKDASVVARKLGESNPTQLAAFLVSEDSSAIDLQVLRENLSEVVATYMIPAEFIFLDSLPENASGKVDRKALAALDLREQQSEAAYVAPETETEKKLAKLICQILKIDQVGRNDDFFLLGGDSLRATALHTQVEAEFSTRIPLHILFKDTRVHGMSANIERSHEEKGSADFSHTAKIIPLNESGDETPLYLTHGVKGQAFVSPHFLSILGPNQPVYAFQASGLNRPDKRHWTIQEMAEQYIEGMREIQPHGPYLIGSICAGCMVALEIADQLRAAGEAVAPILMIDPPIDPPGERSWLRRVRRDLTDRFKRKFSEEKYNKKLEKDFKLHQDKGRIPLDTSDKEALKIACRVAFDFRLALNDYRMKPYDGEVYLLGSRSRLSRGGGKLREKLTGTVEIFDVGERHRDIHEVNNDLFGQQLRAAMDAVIDRLKS
ncbi:hypothetical protein NT6N_34210 [Oceaniferula spumae]|uniref:Carrier domain-containing protein n=1 Tax=Oceaniferula spumae TaxID=2979115 RepID=A0AAT9FQS8_9BACT